MKLGCWLVYQSDFEWHVTDWCICLFDDQVLDDICRTHVTCNLWAMGLEEVEVQVGLRYPTSLSFSNNWLIGIWSSLNFLQGLELNVDDVWTYNIVCLLIGDVGCRFFKNGAFFTFNMPLLIAFSTWVVAMTKAWKFGKYWAKRCLWNHLRAAPVKVFWNICANISSLAPKGYIALMYIFRRDLGQPVPSNFSKTGILNFGVNLMSGKRERDW